MKKRFRIKVTEEDIKAGEPAMATSCPVAHALRREFPHSGIAVGAFSIVLGNRTYRLSKRMTKFIVDFDTSPKRAKPISFTITL